MVDFNTLESKPADQPEVKTTQTFVRDSNGRFTSGKTKVTVTSTTSKSKTIPPLVSFQLTNPIVYIKAWWQRLIGNEGIKLTLQIKPLTAMVLTLMVSGVGFGLGRITIPEPLVKYVPIFASPLPSATPSPWKETAYTGKLQVSGLRYYLLVSSSEAITLEVPGTINLAKMIGKRIMVVGLYNKDTRIMQISDAKDLEILPNSPIPLPTVHLTPTAVPTPMGNL